jgi:hypothetical protein
MRNPRLPIDELLNKANPCYFQNMKKLNENHFKTSKTTFRFIFRFRGLNCLYIFIAKKTQSFY